MVNETRLSKSVVQCPLHHSLTIALGGRRGRAFGYDHLLQQKQNVSEERWLGGNQLDEWMSQVRQEKSLSWEKQDPPRLCGISAGSHECPFLLVGTCSGFAGRLVTSPYSLSGSCLSIPAVPGHRPGTPGWMLGSMGEGLLAPSCVQMPRCPNNQSRCFHIALS